MVAAAHVAQPLRLAAGERREPAEQVGGRQRVDGAQKIRTTTCESRSGRRASVHHAQVQHALAQRLPVPQPLQRHPVAVEKTKKPTAITPRARSGLNTPSNMMIAEIMDQAALIAALSMTPGGQPCYRAGQRKRKADALGRPHAQHVDAFVNHGHPPRLPAPGP